LLVTPSVEKLVTFAPQPAKVVAVTKTISTKLSDLNNSLDSMVLCDEFMEALAYTYSDEMNKQLEAFSEEGMVEHGLGNIKYGSESYGEYVRKLNILSAKAKEIVGYLKRGKTDLSNMRGYVKDIEEKYENVITTVYEKNYCTEDGRRYTKKVLNNRIAGHDEVLKYINDADSKIDKVIKYYTNLIGVIENEKEICDDLHKLTNNEVKVNLFDNLK